MQRTMVFVEASPDFGGEVTPRWARFMLDQALFERLGHLRRLAENENLSNVQIDLCPEWSSERERLRPDGGGEAYMRVHTARLAVDTKQFWFEAHTYGGEAVSTYRIAFNKLEAALRGQNSSEFKFVAGVLAFGVDPEALLDEADDSKATGRQS